MQRFHRKLSNGKRNTDYTEPFTQINRVSIIASSLLMNMTYHPKSPVQVWWHRFGFFLAIVHALITPLQLAFFFNNDEFWWFSRTLDILGLIAIYLGLHMAYFNRDGVLVSHPLSTAKRYFVSRFAMDIIASFPFDIFYNGWYVSGAVEPNVLHASAFIRLTRLISFYKIPIAFSYLEAHQETAIDYIRITKFIIYIGVFMNALTCALFTMACPPFTVFNLNPSQDRVFNVDAFRCLSDSWLGTTTFTGGTTTLFELYTVSFYFSSATLVSVG